MVEGPWWFELLVNPLYNEYIADILLVSIVNVGQKFVVTAHCRTTLLMGFHDRRKIFLFTSRSSCIHGGNDFNVDSADRQAKEMENHHSYKESSEIVNTSVQEKGLFESKPFSREVHHHWRISFNPSLAACDTPQNHRSQNCSQFDHGKRLLYRR